MKSLDTKCMHNSIIILLIHVFLEIVIRRIITHFLITCISRSFVLFFNWFFFFVYYRIRDSTASTKITISRLYRFNYLIMYIETKYSEKNSSKIRGRKSHRTINVFSGVCVRTIDALAKGAQGKLNPPLSG